jgi:hypothetical protein
MLDTPTRVLVAYGLIVLLALAAAAVVWWKLSYPRRRSDARARQREKDHTRRRDAAEALASDG